jgi:hypothetical protein
MHSEEDCGCRQHGKHHGGHGEDCGCGGHGHHGINREWQHYGGCNCGCHKEQGGMKFHRQFVSQEEIIAGLEEYLKQLQAEAKGVEERLAELKKEE